MDKEFVTYEQALALAWTKFDETCFAGYDGFGDLFIGYNSIDGIEYNPSFYTKAPLKQQVFRWFREKYDVDCYITRMLPNVVNKDVYHVVLNDKWAPNDSYKNYEDAESRLIDNLIELVKYRNNGKI
jgi:hypothetical protein